MPYSENSLWEVRIHRRAVKRMGRLPANARVLLEALVRDLHLAGPCQFEWPNYSRLANGSYHCHLNYHFVAVWELVDRKIRILEVTYVGSREDAPY
jgi:mRNA-degrading endonuclease RelE of RelBE toxin-antitoxin system